MDQINILVIRLEASGKNLFLINVLTVNSCVASNVYMSQHFILKNTSLPEKKLCLKLGRLRNSFFLPMRVKSTAVCWLICLSYANCLFVSNFYCYRQAKKEYCDRNQFEPKKKRKILRKTRNFIGWIPLKLRIIYNGYVLGQARLPEYPIKDKLLNIDLILH